MTIKNPWKLDYGLPACRAMTGAGIALILLAGLLLKVGEIESWVYIPIFTTSIGGAFGGILHYFLSDVYFKAYKY